LGAIRRLVESEPERAIEMIDALRADVATATGDIRRLVYELRPPMLDEFGLEGAIANLCASGDVPRFFEIAEPLPKLSAATEVALFRIVSEALHNVDRHSKAKECRIRLDAGADDVTLVVADDGVGMDRPGPKGVGMISMRERAEELGGSVAWSSGPGGGCVVRATVPI
jgi:signal transduction histidine kinase